MQKGLNHGEILSMKSKNGVLIMDHSPVIRIGIQAILSKHFKFRHFDQVSSSEEAYSLLQINKYAIIILDIGIPYNDSFQLIKNLRIQYPDTYMLVCTLLPANFFAVHLLKLGIHGYVHKSISENEMVTAIKIILGGRLYFSSFVQEIINEIAINGNAFNPFAALSYTEISMIPHMLNNRTIAEISNILGIKKSIVSSYKSKIIKKVSSRNFDQLVVQYRTACR